MESKAGLLLLHYQNLLGLCREQLAAVQKGQYERLEAVLDQKAMISRQIDKLLNADATESKYPREIGAQLRKMICEMISLEEECQKHVSEQLDAVQKTYKSLRRENQLAGKYDSFLETSVFFDQKK